jgi:hypothetical protein
LKISKLLGAAVVVGATLPVHAGVILSEGFDNVAALSGQGWAQSNSGGLGAGWFQGNTGIFGSSSGAPNSYAAANFVSTVTTISDWLMTPVINAGGVTLTFDLRLLGDGFLDTVEIYTSDNGASTNVADFTTLAATFSANADTGWLTQTVSLAAFNGRIGIRYFVANTNSDGNYVGLDSLSVVPEPTSVALVALALAGLAASRRRA